MGWLWASDILYQMILQYKVHTTLTPQKAHIIIVRMYWLFMLFHQAELYSFVFRHLEKV